jgi:hypothetical protein
MLRALALADERPVPTVRKRRVSALRLGVSVIAGERRVGTGYSEYAEVAVRTIMNERRGFESARRVESWRRSELTGKRADNVVSFEGASGGNAASTGREPDDTDFASSAAAVAAS